LQAKKPAGVINEAVRQVALADTIVINKLDLVTSEQLKSVTQYIRYSTTMLIAKVTSPSTV
jgi:G3E family GTPase